MILKDAYRYKNFIDTLLDNSIMFLNRQSNITITTETHMRSKVRPEAEDETKSSLDDRELNVSADQILDFISLVIDEEEALCQRINEAKLNYCPTIDHELSMNKVRQKVANCLRHVANTKNRDWIKSGSSYCFNSEGNQVSYLYDVKYEMKIDFSRRKFKDALYKLTEQSDKVSNEAEVYMSSVEVDFAPQFNINDSFEEIIEQLSDYGIGATA